MDFLRQLVSRVQDLLRRMTVAQRMSVAMLSLSVLVSLFLLVIWAVQTEWEPLFAGPQDPEYVQEVVARLAEKKTRFKQEGPQILVQRGTRDEVIMTLSKEKLLPKAKDLGDWLFQDSLVESASRFDAKNLWTTKRRVEEMILTGAPEVKAAKVEFAAPPRRSELLYEHEINSGTASVVVSLKPGVDRLSKDSVESIAFVVSRIVPNTPPQNVSIVANGRHQTVADPNDPTTAGSKQMDEKLLREAILEKKIREILAFIPDVLVKVDELVDHSTQEVSKFEVDPDNFIHKEQHTREAISQTPKPAGEPGVMSNASASIAGGSVSTAVMSEKEKDYFPPDYGKTTTKTTRPPGERKKLTVAVVIPAAAYPGVPRKGEEIDRESPVFKDLISKDDTPEHEKVRKIVEGAVGEDLKEAEESKVVVSFFDIPVAPREPAPDFWTRLQLWFDRYGGQVFMGIMTLIALLMIFGIVKKAIPRPEPVYIAEEEEVKADEETEEAIVGPATMSVEDRKRMFIREKVGEIIEGKPDTAAKLIKGWMWQERH